MTIRDWKWASTKIHNYFLLQWYPNTNVLTVKRFSNSNLLNVMQMELVLTCQAISENSLNDYIDKSFHIGWSCKFYKSGTITKIQLLILMSHFSTNFWNKNILIVISFSVGETNVKTVPVPNSDGNHMLVIVQYNCDHYFSNSNNLEFSWISSNTLPFGEYAKHAMVLASRCIS